MTKEEAENSLSFQSLKIGEWKEYSSELNSLAEQFCLHLNVENKRDIPQYKRWFKVFLINSIVSYRTDKSIAIFLDRDRYKNKEFDTKSCAVNVLKKKQCNKFMKYTHVKTIFEWLKENGYIDVYPYNQFKHRRTRFRPTDKLLDCLNITADLKITFDELNLVTFSAEICGEKVYTSPPTGAMAHNRRCILKKWAKLASVTDIQLLGKPIVNPLLVSRFCHAELGNLNKGGRFYCLVPLHNSWQAVSNDAKRGYDRSSVTINGNKTVELDYKSLHVSMAFNEQGKKLDYDPYLVFGLEQRDFCKKILMTMINCENDINFVRFIKDRRWKTVNKRIEDDTQKYFLEFEKDIEGNSAILSKGFEKYVNSNKGVDFQFLDSIMMEAVLKHFNDKGVLVLPIHDSAIIEEQYEDELKQVMTDAYKDIMGFKIEIDKKGRKI